jgi:CheY-like chemotaxis protein
MRGMGKNKKELKLKHVLVVDDDDDCLELISDIFLQNGVTVTLAHNGLEAKDELEKSENFDAIITDILMPQMNGYQLCELVGHQLPIVLISVLESDSVSSEYLDLTDAYISKNEIQKSLIKATSKALDRWWSMGGKGPVAA